MLAEVQNSPQLEVELLGPAPLFEVAVVQILFSGGVRRVEAICQRLEPEFHRHLDLFTEAFASVVGKLRRVANEKRVGVVYLGLQFYRQFESPVVDLCHSLNLLKSNVISIAIWVPLVLMQKYHSFLIFGYVGHQTRLGFLSILVEASETFAEIHKCESIQTEQSKIY